MLKPVDKQSRIMDEIFKRSSNLRKYKSDAFQPNTLVCFQDLLRVLINVECRNEALRQSLNKLSNYDVKKLYDNIDKLDKGYISDVEVIYLSYLFNILNQFLVG